MEGERVGWVVIGPLCSNHTKCHLSFDRPSWHDSILLPCRTHIVTRFGPSQEGILWMTFWRWDLEKEILFPNGLSWGSDQFHRSWHLYLLSLVMGMRGFHSVRLAMSYWATIKPSVAVRGCLLSALSEILESCEIALLFLSFVITGNQYNTFIDGTGSTDPIWKRLALFRDAAERQWYC